MDGLKLYASLKKRNLHPSLKDSEFSSTVGMELGIEKCGLSFD